MGFHEVSFPLNPEYASRFAPGFRNSFSEQRNGAVEVTVHAERPRRVFDLKGQIKSSADAESLLTFWHARTGGANGFRLRDWTDYTTAADRTSAPANTDRNIGTGDGVTTAFTLRTTYVSGGITKNRPIQKPVAGTVLVAVAGVGLVEGVDWTVNTTTGVVTFTAAPAASAAITAGCEFEVPVRFSPETDANLALVVSAYDVNAIERINAVEDINPSALDDERHFGGGRAFGPIAANLSLAVLDGAAISFNPSVTGLIVTLPAIGTLPAVGPDFFVVLNESAVYTLTIKDAGGATIVAIGPLGAARLGVFAVDEVGTTAWRAS